MQARELNGKLFSFSDESTWPLAYLHAAVKAWWLAEYSGFYLDDPPESSIPPNTDLDEGKLIVFATHLLTNAKARGSSEVETISGCIEGRRFRFSPLYIRRHQVHRLA